ncbi:MAG: hypothetical protein GQ574_28330 [Crocinitomix sp.]|nr:hypothetical protein [Crocinitomix sp.]
MKTSFILFILSICIQTGAFAQDSEKCEALSEMQSFMLMDNKISFHSSQIDFASIAVVLCTATEADLILPKIVVSDDETTVTIDFNGCNKGTYVISGSRADLILDYAVEL